MKSSTTDQIKGKTNDPGLAAQGGDEKIAGKVQKVEQIKKVFGR